MVITGSPSVDVLNTRGSVAGGGGGGGVRGGGGVGRSVCVLGERRFDFVETARGMTPPGCPGLISPVRTNGT